jgi:hypothetical protein
VPCHVCNGATMMCTFGMAPSTLIVLPMDRVLTSSQPAATIMDHIPMLNVMPFGMCFSPSNPMFIAATAAALGVPTPVPCIPMTMAPWIIGAPTVVQGMKPTLDNISTLMCTWAGVITITVPGQMTEMIP